MHTQVRLLALNGPRSNGRSERRAKRHRQARAVRLRLMEERYMTHVEMERLTATGIFSTTRNVILLYMSSSI